MGVDAGFVPLGVWVWDRGGEWEEWECGAGLMMGMLVVVDDDRDDGDEVIGRGILVIYC